MDPTPETPDAEEPAVPVAIEAGSPYSYLEPPFSTLRTAERAVSSGDYTAAIALYTSISAEYSSAALQVTLDEAQQHAVYEAHLGYLDALARAGRLDELAVLAETNNQARRRLDRQLYQEGRADDLQARAINGDRAALHLLVYLLRARGEDDRARQTVQDLAPDNEYARKLAFGAPPGPWPPSDPPT